MENGNRLRRMKMAAMRLEEDVIRWEEVPFAMSWEEGIPIGVVGGNPV